MISIILSLMKKENLLKIYLSSTSFLKGLSSYRGSPPPGGRKMRDPGNKVDWS